MARVEYKRCKDKFFVNPYTFVDVDRTVKTAADAEEFYRKEELHTGYLECRLLTRTPLGIPDDERKQVGEKGHAFYPFFSVCGGQPLIPGSSIRGVIRSVYETVSDSCLSTMQENTGLSFRVENRNAYKPGLLIREKGPQGEEQWKLYEAERYRIPCRGKNDPKFKVEFNEGKRVIQFGKDTYEYGDQVSFKAAERRGRGDRAVQFMKSGTNENAYIYIGEAFSRKNNEGIFQKRKLYTDDAEQTSRALSLLEESLKIYRDKAVNKEYRKDDEKGSGGAHTGYAGFERAKKAGVLPVWYAQEGSILRFSMAAIGRSFARKSLNELVGKKSPCRKREALCEACRLFGMVGEEAIGSRVRFSDAEAVRISEIHRGVTLKELGLPRYSYMPFHAKGKTGAVTSYDDRDVEIRGRKFYWHNPDINGDLGICRTKEKTPRNATLDLVDTDSEFKFRVFYDGISRRQLEQLKWALTLGENEESSRLCHKIGHGKPLGLGSCKIVVQEEVERSTEAGGELVYGIVRETDRNKLAGSIDEAWKEGRSCQGLLKVCDLDAVKGENITYPYIVSDVPEAQRRNKNAYANHQWFTNNKGRRRGDPPAQQLPDVMAEDQRLRLYEIKENTQGGGYRNTGDSGNYGSNRNHDGNKNYGNNRKRY